MHAAQENEEAILYVESSFHPNFLRHLPPLAVPGITPSNKPAAKSSSNEGILHLEFAWGLSCLVTMGVCGKDNGLDVYEYGIGGLYMCKGNAGGRAAWMGYIPG